MLLEVSKTINQIMPFSIDSSNLEEEKTNVSSKFQSILENLKSEYCVKEKQYTDTDADRSNNEFDEELDDKELTEVINAIAEVIMYIKINYKEIDNADLNNIFEKLNETQNMLESIHDNKGSIYLEKEIGSLINLLGQADNFDLQNLNDKIILNNDAKHLDISFRAIEFEGNDEKIDEVEKIIEKVNKKLMGILDLQSLKDEKISFQEIKNEQQKDEIILDDDTEHLNFKFEEIKVSEKGETASYMDSNGESFIENGKFQSTKNEYSHFVNILANDVANIDNEIELNLIQDINREELIQQIVEKFEIIENQDKQEVKIKLKPDYLGELVLKMELDDGAIVAKLIVDNNRTKDIIESGLYQLKEQFKNNGLEVKTIDVFIGANEEFAGEKRNRYNFSKSQSRLKISNKLVEEFDQYSINSIDQNTSINYEGRLNLFV